MLQDLRQSRRARTLLWCPSRDGHLRYTLSLAHALDEQDPSSGLGIGLLTTRPRNSEPPQSFPVWHVGHEIRNRRDFSSSLHWATDRSHRRLTLERQLCAFVSEHPEIDLVHLQELYPLTALSTLRRLHALGRAVVLTLHNTVPHSVPFGVPGWVWRRLTRSYLQQVDAIIVHSRALAREAVQIYGLEPARVHAVAHGTWNDEAGRLSSPTSIFQAPSERQQVRLLTFGQIRRNKGLHHLLDALNGAPPAWHLLVAGSIAENDYWSREIVPRLARLRAQGRVIDVRTNWIPPTSVPALFGASDIVVLPYEGFHAQSGVLFDAVAHRRPVVATRDGTLGETISELGIGTLADSLAPAHLRQAIATAATIIPAEMEPNWALARERYSWSRAARETRDIYEHVLERSSILRG